MKIQLIAVGQKMPRWIQEGFAEYAKRFPPEISFSLIEIPAEKRGKKADIERITDKEGEKMLAAIPKGNRVITLEVEGKAWSTHDLSERFQLGNSMDAMSLYLVGGPEGLAPACLAARDGTLVFTLTMTLLIGRQSNLSPSRYFVLGVFIISSYHRE